MTLLGHPKKAKTKITMNNPRPEIFINRRVEVTAPSTAFPVQATSALVVLDATEAAGLLTRSTENGLCCRCKLSCGKGIVAWTPSM
mmetsp:Transcript_108159/g.131962  ORF Transcript_108159/g.131962 Transcript_108159/m.131962 type:complete len:86 (-) Transcript_108159:109-366(-)